MILRTIIDNNIPSLIPISSPGVSITEIAKRTNLPEDRLIQILRKSTSINIFREPTPRMFAHTSTSALLATPEYNNAIDLLLHHLDAQFKTAGYFSEALTLYGNELDKVQKPELRTAFNLTFKTDEHFFDWIYKPENIEQYGDKFGRAMIGASDEKILDQELSMYDWRKVDKGCKIVDVGGGVGHIGVWIARNVKPGVDIIVQDLPAVIEQGREMYGNDVDFQPVNFLDEQPVIGATVYFLRHILHDWPDSICRTILGHLHCAMDPDSKLIIVDIVLRDDNYWSGGSDDQHLIDGFSVLKRHIGGVNMFMMNTLGQSLSITNPRSQRTQRKRMARIILQRRLQDHHHQPRPRLIIVDRSNQIISSND
jgi:hypothetical protein